jgi:hypothetical protein
VLRYLPPALLVVVAIHQAVLVETRDLTPWLGGGFGMFSTTEGPGDRIVRAIAILPAGEREVRIPSALEDRAYRARALPEDRRLRGLASDIARLEPVARLSPRAIRVEVWNIAFDRETLAPRVERLRTYVHRVR